MAKIVTDKELADIVRRIVEGDLIDEAGQYREFLTRLGILVTDFMGGELGGVNFDHVDKEEDGRLFQEVQWLLGIRHNDCVPEDGGIWKDYDKDCPVEQWSQES